MRKKLIFFIIVNLSLHKEALKKLRTRYLDNLTFLHHMEDELNILKAGIVFYKIFWYLRSLKVITTGQKHNKKLLKFFFNGENSENCRKTSYFWHCLTCLGQWVRNWILRIFHPNKHKWKNQLLKITLWFFSIVF